MFQLWPVVTTMPKLGNTRLFRMNFITWSPSPLRGQSLMMKDGPYLLTDTILHYAASGQGTAIITNRPVSGVGGSIIDYFFVSDSIFNLLSPVELATEPESTHLRLSFSLEVKLSTNLIDTQNKTVCRKIDNTKITRMKETSLKNLAVNPSRFSAVEAYSEITSFIDKFTFISDSHAAKNRNRPPTPKSQIPRRKMRRIERDEKKDGTFCQQKLRSLIAEWKEMRNLEVEELASSTWKLWRSANRTGNPKRAWDLVRSKLPGYKQSQKFKAITIPEWECHFDNIYNPPNTPDLIPFPPANNKNSYLDAPFHHSELTYVLNKKHNHKAPGPDGYKY